MNLYKVTMFLICLSTPLMSLAQGTTAQEFEYYQSMLKSNTSSAFVAERLNADSNFNKLQESETWIFNDSEGQLSISINDPSGATVIYYPSSSSQFGDAALASLINKSDSMIVSEGNLLELRFDYSGFSQYLSFSLSNGAWTETSVLINWQ